MYEDDYYANGGHQSPGQSGLGIASFLLALAGAVVLIAAISWVAYMAINHPGRIDADEESPAMMLLGLAVLGSIGAEVLALVLGIVALSQTGRSKVLAILGVIFSGGGLALLAFLIVVGALAG